jgi:gluconolactonase
MAFNYNPRVVASGMGFIEGPIACEDGTLLVLDMSRQSIERVDPATGRIETFAKTGGGPNGAAFGPDGAIYLCNNGGLYVEKTPEGGNLPQLGAEWGGRITPCIQRVAPDGTVSTLYTHCGEHPLQAPNDIVFDAHGGFYFTDLGHFDERHVDVGGLYYAKPDGSSISELVHEPNLLAPLTQPNGVGLSPAGDRVYISETVTGRCWAWAISGPGQIAPMPEPLSANGAALLYGQDNFGMFDSLAVDGEGFICAATLMKGGISVMNPAGGLEEFIPMPEYDAMVTNICFGGPDLRTAYVTSAGTGKVWALDWPRSGLRLNYAR